MRDERLRGAMLLAALLVVAGAARWLLLSDWLSYDECQHFLVARTPLGTDFVREFRARAHPPLAYLMMKPFVLLDSSALAAQMASLLSGLAAVLLCWRLLRELGLPAASAALGALLAGLAPVFVQQSVEVRQYAPCLVFVWASMLVYARIQRAGLTWRRSAAIALWLGLALATEYSAAFYVAAVTVVASLTQAWRIWQEGGRAAGLLRPLPLVGVLALGTALFAWQFSNDIPSYNHTRPHTYQGSLLDLAEIARFLGNGFASQLSGLLPEPWGLALLPLLIAGLVLPAAGHSPRRAFSAVALLALAATAVAALAGRFPLGGTARHGAATLPVAFLAGFLMVEQWMRTRLPSGRPRRVAAALASLGTVALFAVGTAALPREPSPEPGIRQVQHDYALAPRPIIANWRGRSLASWWLLRERTPRLREERGGTRVFAYDRIPVTEAPHEIAVLRNAIDCARRRGRCWVFLGHLSGERSDIEALAKSLELARGVTVSRVEEVALDVPALLIVVEAEGDVS